MVQLRGTVAFVLLATLLVACDGSPTAPSPTPVTPVTPVTPEDFSGQVLTPSDRDRSRSYSEAVTDVTVTIIAGPRSGEKVLTTPSGQYTFAEVEGDELQIRLEKAGYEPKEVVVHRSRATVLRDDPVPLEYGGPQDRPGIVLIGVAWPEYARQILSKMPVIADLLLISAPGSGSYGWGVVTQDPTTMDSRDLTHIPHELCHAWQHGKVRPRGGGTGGGTDWFAEWVASPEGIAYREARNADRRQIGYNPIGAHPTQDTDPWVETDLVLVEESATFCNYWHGHGNLHIARYSISFWREWLRQHAHNRVGWLERFLGL